MPSQWEGNYLRTITGRSPEGNEIGVAQAAQRLAEGRLTEGEVLTARGSCTVRLSLGDFSNGEPACGKRDLRERDRVGGQEAVWARVQPSPFQPR